MRAAFIQFSSLSSTQSSSDCLTIEPGLSETRAHLLHFGFELKSVIYICLNHLSFWIAFVTIFWNWYHFGIDLHLKYLVLSWPLGRLQWNERLHLLSFINSILYQKPYGNLLVMLLLILRMASGGVGRFSPFLLWSLCLDSGWFVCFDAWPVLHHLNWVKFWTAILDLHSRPFKFWLKLMNFLLSLVSVSRLSFQYSVWLIQMHLTFATTKDSFCSAFSSIKQHHMIFEIQRNSRKLVQWNYSESQCFWIGSIFICFLNASKMVLEAFEFRGCRFSWPYFWRPLAVLRLQVPCSLRQLYWPEYLAEIHSSFACSFSRTSLFGSDGLNCIYFR